MGFVQQAPGGAVGGALQAMKATRLIFYKIAINIQRRNTGNDLLRLIYNSVEGYIRSVKSFHQLYLHKEGVFTYLRLVYYFMGFKRGS